MTSPKIIWAEGIFLGQQHFQQWDSYLEEQQRLHLTNIAPLNWGIQSLLIDEEALANSRFRIKKCSAIFRNGPMINYDALEDQPLVCELKDHKQKIIPIYLCLPMNHQVNGITGYGDTSKLATWQADYHSVADIFDANRQREVLFGKLNLQLLCADQARDAFYVLKIAEVINVGYEGYQLVKTFIPAMTKIQASEVLRDILQRLLETIAAKIAVLSEQRRKNTLNDEFDHSNLQSFLLLQILNCHWPVLQHYQQHLTTHPEKLFLTLTELAARLAALTSEFSLSQFPSYQQENLFATFFPLQQLIKNLFETVMPTQIASLKLRRENETLYLVDSIDTNLLSKHHFFIAVSFQAEDVQWIAQFARQIKVAAAQIIESVVTSALPGITVIHTQRPPNKLAVKTGYEYFYLENSGNFCAD